MKQKQIEQPTSARAEIWGVSNLLSMFRLFLVIPVVLLLREPYRYGWLILFIGIIAYISDLGDGYVARRFGKESNFGRLIDPLADKVFVMGTIIMLMVQHLIPLWFVIIVVARDLVIFLSGMYLRAKTGILAQSTIAGKAAVVSVMLVMVCSLFRDSVDSALYNGLLLISLGLLTASSVMYEERFRKLLSKQKKIRKK